MLEDEYKDDDVNFDVPVIGDPAIDLQMLDEELVSLRSEMEHTDFALYAKILLETVSRCPIKIAEEVAGKYLTAHFFDVLFSKRSNLLPSLPYLSGILDINGVVERIDGDLFLKVVAEYDSLKLAVEYSRYVHPESASALLDFLVNHLDKNEDLALEGIRFLYANGLRNDDLIEELFTNKKETYPQVYRLLQFLQETNEGLKAQLIEDMKGYKDDEVLFVILTVSARFARDIPEVDLDAIIPVLVERFEDSCRNLKIAIGSFLSRCDPINISHKCAVFHIFIVLLTLTDDIPVTLLSITSIYLAANDPTRCQLAKMLLESRELLEIQSDNEQLSNIIQLLSLDPN